MYGKRKKMNKGKEVLGKALRLKAAVDTGGMSEVVRGLKNVVSEPGQKRRKARRAKRKARRAERANNYAGGEQIKNKTSFTQPRKTLNAGGQPHRMLPCLVKDQRNCSHHTSENNSC